MMNSDFIIETIKAEYPSVYIDIISHNGEENEYQVRCFGVERTEFRKVRRKIISIAEELFPANEVSLISIVFTKEDTIAHFPEIARLLAVEDVCCGRMDAGWFLGGYALPETLPIYAAADDCEPMSAGLDTITPSISTGLVSDRWTQSIGSIAADDDYAMAA